VSLDKLRRNVGKGSALATVNGQVAVEGELLFALGDFAS
jgi:3-hydroxymyristoyl/3-hydroxydecanoyl-(acyl carrier protein) dehydratase